MTEADLQQLFLTRHGLRIEKEMSRYVAGKILAGNANEIAVIGGDARTGVPRLEIVSAASLAAGAK